MTTSLLKRAGAVLAIAAATWLALALVLYFLLPRTIEEIYQNVARAVLQVECGRAVASELIYTLAPGDCRFANPEFETRVAVDADGFRNAPEHLGTGPLKVAVLGDSHAMGWGVGQGEKLASLLARDSRLSVRDLSMSSYGTPRELFALALHAPDADVIVLQYCFNDRSENATYLADPTAFSSGAMARSKAYAEEMARERDHVTSLRRTVLRSMLAGLSASWRVIGLPPRTPRQSPPHVVADEARLFAGVLARFKNELAGKRVIVFESFPRAPRIAFAAAFRTALTEAGIADVHVLDLVGALGPRDFYHIDEHMRPAGHAKVARAVLAEIDKLAPGPGRR